MADFYLLLRVNFKGGVLKPLWYTVRGRGDWESFTEVGYESTIAVCPLDGTTLESAVARAHDMLPMVQHLLGSATPEPWLAERLGLSAPVARVEPDPGSFAEDLERYEAEQAAKADLEEIIDDPELEADVDNVLARAEVLLKYRLEQQGFITTGKERNVPRQVHSKEGRRALVRALLEIL